MGGDAVAQAVVAELLASGALERHVRRVRRVHAARREALLEALDEHMPDGVRWTRPGGGRTVWLTLPDAVDPQALAAAAGEAGIAYERGDAFWLDPRGRHHVSLGFVNQDEEALRKGAAELAALVARELRRGGNP